MEQIRPSKKQKELFDFIEAFIKTNGYGPSYREIMRALGYKSVSTVAVHVDGLVTAGQLVKKDRSPRSLEIPSTPDFRKEREEHIAWLQSEIARREADGTEMALQEVAVLRRALTVFTP